MVLAPTYQRLIIWWLLFLALLLPLVWLIYRAIVNDLGSDPVQELVQSTGDWALRCLWATLAVTPLRIYLKWTWLQRFRRMLGLYTLFYASIHFVAFVSLILEWQWSRIYSEFLERPYISVGAVAFLLLIPLGITSFKFVMKKMGRSWMLLHRSVYVVAILVFVHLLWQVRSDYLEVIVYGALLALLFIARLIKVQIRKN